MPFGTSGGRQRKKTDMDMGNLATVSTIQYVYDSRKIHAQGINAHSKDFDNGFDAFILAFA